MTDRHRYSGTGQAGAFSEAMGWREARRYGRGCLPPLDAMGDVMRDHPTAKYIRNRHDPVTGDWIWEVAGETDR